MPATPESPRQIALDNVNTRLRNFFIPNSIHTGGEAGIIGVSIAREVMDIPPLETLLFSYSFMAHFMAGSVNSQRISEQYLQRYELGVRQFRSALEAFDITIPDTIITTSLAQGQVLAQEFLAAPVIADRRITIDSIERSRNAIAEVANMMGGDNRRHIDNTAAGFTRGMFGIQN